MDKKWLVVDGNWKECNIQLVDKPFCHFVVVVSALHHVEELSDTYEWSCHSSHSFELILLAIELYLNLCLCLYFSIDWEKMKMSMKMKRQQPQFA
jgi:hypothetical protein